MCPCGLAGGCSSALLSPAPRCSCSCARTRGTQCSRLRLLCSPSPHLSLQPPGDSLPLQTGLCSRVISSESWSWPPVQRHSPFPFAHPCIFFFIALVATRRDFVFIISLPDYKLYEARDFFLPPSRLSLVPRTFSSTLDAQ